jgi:hypothetical protein
MSVRLTHSAVGAKGESVEVGPAVGLVGGAVACGVERMSDVGVGTDAGVGSVVGMAPVGRADGLGAGPPQATRSSAIARVVIRNGRAIQAG